MAAAGSDNIVVQRALPARGLPSATSLRNWAAFARGRNKAGLTLRIVGLEEGQSLNRDWRGKDYATNVLSFPFEERGYLGDIVVCAPVVAREATEQGKPLRAHWAHMVVHGVLHLQGYDHVDDAEAEAMEALERKMLAKLGYADPYAGHC